MAEEKKNPLIGAFRSPPPKEAAKAPPDAKVAESVKPSTADKPIPAAQKPAEPVKPVIPPKAEETKAAPKPNGTATPVKPTEEKPAAKPPVPTKAEDAKAAVKPAVPAKPEEAKSTAKPEEKKAEKPAPAAAADTKPAKEEEKKPVAAPSEKKSEEKKPEEKLPAKQEEKKADVPAKTEDISTRRTLWGTYQLNFRCTSTTSFSSESFSKCCMVLPSVPAVLLPLFFLMFRYANLIFSGRVIISTSLVNILPSILSAYSLS